MANQNNQNQNTTYSFIDLKSCIGRNGNPYVGITVDGLVANVGELQTSKTGKKVISFSIPIHGSVRYITEFFNNGLTPDTDSKDSNVIWARVTMWEKTAERFVKYLEKHPRPVIVLTGAVELTQNQSNGTVYTNVNITANNFRHILDRDQAQGGQSRQNNQQGGSYRGQGQPQQQGQRQGQTRQSGTQGGGYQPAGGGYQPAGQPAQGASQGGGAPAAQPSYGGGYDGGLPDESGFVDFEDDDGDLPF